MTETDPDEDLLAAGRSLCLGPVTFMLSVAGLEQIPESPLPEVAFAGRSNVGKSSLINALLDRKEMARTSATPGRTQQLNYFDVGGRLLLVDMPGYGYAKAPKDMVRRWQGLIFAYLRGRASLRRVFLLIDSRHGPMANDKGVMDLLDQCAVTYQVVLTKADKVKAGALQKAHAACLAAMDKRPAAFPVILQTSSAKGHGMDDLRAAMAGITVS